LPKSPLNTTLSSLPGLTMPPKSPPDQRCLQPNRHTTPDDATSYRLIKIQFPKQEAEGESKQRRCKTRRLQATTMKATKAKKARNCELRIASSELHKQSNLSTTTRCLCLSSQAVSMDEANMYRYPLLFPLFFSRGVVLEIYTTDIIVA
jgi:hypothetical protein